MSVTYVKDPHSGPEELLWVDSSALFADLGSWPTVPSYLFPSPPSLQDDLRLPAF